MEKENTIKVNRRDGKLEKSFGNLYFCGHATKNTWWLVLDATYSNGNREYVLNVPPGPIPVLEDKRERKPYKLKDSWKKNNPGFTSPR